MLTTGEKRYRIKHIQVNMCMQTHLQTYECSKSFFLKLCNITNGDINKQQTLTHTACSTCQSTHPTCTESICLAPHKLNHTYLGLWWPPPLLAVDTEWLFCQHHPAQELESVAPLCQRDQKSSSTVLLLANPKRQENETRSFGLYQAPLFVFYCVTNNWDILLANTTAAGTFNSFLTTETGIGRTVYMYCTCIHVVSDIHKSQKCLPTIRMHIR